MRIFILLTFLNIFLLADSDYYKKEFHLPKDLSFLHLNGKQKKNMKEILKAHRKALKKLHEAEEEWEEHLKREFIKDKFERKKFIKKSLELKKKVIELEANFFQKMHTILNKKQRAKFIEYIEEWEVE